MKDNFVNGIHGRARNSVYSCHFWDIEKANMVTSESWHVGAPFHRHCLSAAW